MFDTTTTEKQNSRHVNECKRNENALTLRVRFRGKTSNAAAAVENPKVTAERNGFADKPSKLKRTILVS